ncbi:MAG: hypothetical protein JNM80_02580 [Phycisphaerae bacterium]|nr:hypothetical protein [Phycisphaerae bacterium]
MRGTIGLAAALLSGLLNVSASAQEVHRGAHAGNCCFEGFPPRAVPVPGLPGARTHPDVPEGYVLIEGDIQVPLDEYRAFRAGADSAFGTVNYWPATIPYSFDSGVSVTNQQRAVDAMNAISARVGVVFVPITTFPLPPNRILFRNSDGNSSPIGMQPIFNVINIFNWDFEFVIIHEIYHSLGFWHEQVRPDRDTFVTIHWANIQSGEGHNFEMVSGASTYGPYDFDSFMHYPRWAFSANGMDTITVNPPWNAQWQNRIGQRDHFSVLDEITGRGIYRFPTDRWWKPNAGGNGFGNLVNPLPHATFVAAYTAVPAGSTLFIRDAGTYPVGGVLSKAMTIRAPLGARLGN